jgi:hypothetical protein
MNREGGRGGTFRSIAGGFTGDRLQSDKDRVPLERERRKRRKGRRGEMRRGKDHMKEIEE